MLCALPPLFPCTCLVPVWTLAPVLPLLLLCPYLCSYLPPPGFIHLALDFTLPAMPTTHTHYLPQFWIVPYHWNTTPTIALPTLPFPLPATYLPHIHTPSCPTHTHHFPTPCLIPGRCFRKDLLLQRTVPCPSHHLPPCPIPSPFPLPPLSPS